MPREQAKLRALRRLTNNINDMLFHKDFIDTVFHMRSRLRIDVRELQDIEHALYVEHGMEEGHKDFWKTN